MSLEMVGSRILAPYFGNSIFVWGSLIGVFLTALAVGYYLGGMLADRWPHLNVLAGFLAVAALLVLGIPAASAPVNIFLDARFPDPRVGALLATSVLFAAPTILLGTISPYAVRLEARSLAGVGNTAGMLYALSTAGSILGTFATAFVLVPAMGVKNIVYLLGASLLLLAALGYVTAGARRERKAKLGLPMALVALAGVVALSTFSSLGPTARPKTPGSGTALGTVLLEEDTLYHHLVVAEQRGVRYLQFDDSVQGAMYVAQPSKTPVQYIPRMTVGLMLQPQPKRALLIGLGPGSLPKLLLEAYPRLGLDVAEIDPEVLDVARGYFNLPEDTRLRIHIADGRDFLEAGGPGYDLVFIDAYYASAIPFHLTTKEFLEKLKGGLEPGGAVVANIIGAVTGDQSRLFRAMYKTFRSVFSGVYVFQDPATVGQGAAGGAGAGSVASSNPQNLILVASREARGTKAFSAEALPVALANGVAWVTRADLLRYAGGLYTGTIKVDDVPLLTDDYAPLDSLFNVYRETLTR